MNDETCIKFERGVRAPDGIHEADMQSNGTPMTTVDILYVGLIGLTYLALCTFAYYLG